MTEFAKNKIIIITTKILFIGAIYIAFTQVLIFRGTAAILIYALPVVFAILLGIKLNDKINGYSVILTISVVLYILSLVGGNFFGKGTKKYRESDKGNKTEIIYISDPGAMGVAKVITYEYKHIYDSELLEIMWLENKDIKKLRDTDIDINNIYN